MNWRNGKIDQFKSFALKSLAIILIVWITCAIIGKTALGGIGLGLAIYLFYGTLKAFGQKIGFGINSRTDVVRRLKAQPAAVYGFLLAHLGMAVFTAGATIMSVWAVDETARLKIGESINVSGYKLVLADVQPGKRDNYEYLSGTFSLSKNEKNIKSFNSEQRYYNVRDMVTTEAGFHLTLGPTLFASIGDGNAEEGWVTRAYYHPYIIWIWIGALMMALAGFVSLLDRRFQRNRSSSRPVVQSKVN